MSASVFWPITLQGCSSSPSPFPQQSEFARLAEVVSNRWEEEFASHAYNVTTQRCTYYSSNYATVNCYPNNSDTKWDDHWKRNDKDEYHSRQHDDDTLDDYGDDNTKHNKHNSWQYDHINYNDKRHDDGYYNSKCHDHGYYHNNDQHDDHDYYHNND
ncbi:hypothetical protein FOZ60_004855 [Perkinsus olseni]|uniref:Uncharacterized protein n=1 Tax=Perkinsus olseni TaxID=32597 RepID=A0A7J6PGX2_PEROL|nr:hypothetical protein FOZ60_004855 [Perkinsus olseni]